MSPLRAQWTLSLLAAFAVTAVSCADVITPTELSPLDGAAAAVKSPVSPGNSAGTATIEARVLINGAGIATLEVTTGKFDAGDGAIASKGRIENVHVKVYNAAGKQVAVKNFNSVPANTGQVMLTLPGVTKDNTIYVQANIKGIDGKRTDVVRSGVPVQWSPEIDLSASPIVLFPSGEKPDLVQLNTATDFQIAFSNGGPNAFIPGDVGVRASCDIYVNGVKFDVPTEWSGFPDGTVRIEPTAFIPANDVRLCKFTYTFETEGWHRIRVVANAISPSDYDPSNNESLDSVFVTQETPLKYEFLIAETAQLDVPESGLVKDATLVGLKQQSATVEFKWDEPTTTDLVPTILRLMDDTDGIILDQREYSLELPAALPTCAAPRPIGVSGETPVIGSVFSRPYYRNPPQISVCVESQDATTRTIRLQYVLLLADGKTGHGLPLERWPLYVPTYTGGPIIPFGEVFGFTGYVKRTVNGEVLEFGGVRKCARLLLPLETTTPGPYERIMVPFTIVPGSCGSL